MNIIPDSASQEADVGDDKTFITKLLGEMKTQFNSSEKKISSEAESEPEENSIINKVDVSDSKVLEEEKNEIVDGMDNTINDASIVTDKGTKDEVNTLLSNSPAETAENSVTNGDEEKPRLLIKFIKPSSRSPSKKKLRNGEDNEKLMEVNLKRSSRRRRSSESVLQSAIARKEKSYNESMKPQRSSRQLKPTQKILDNIANAALKLEKGKIKLPKHDKQNDLNDEMVLNKVTVIEDQRKHKHRNNNHKHKKNIKKFKSNEYKDSDSEQPPMDFKDDLHNKCNGRNSRNKSHEDKMFRRSQRLSSSRTRDDESVNGNESEVENVSTADDQSVYPAEPECSSVGAELIASKLCLCMKQSQIYTVNESDEVIYCKGIDNVGDKLLGCNNVIEAKEIQLFRTSHRVPFMILCEVHKNRLFRHNCCPACGVFCTQGRFVQCQNKHIYHRKCQICVGNVECCPHCGVFTPQYDVHVSMTCSNEPYILPMQRLIAPSAKMTFQASSNDESDYAKRCESPLLVSMNICVPEIVDVHEEYDINDLFESVKEQNLNRLALILGSKTVPLITVIDEGNGQTVLHYAVKNGMLNVVHMLVITGIDIDVFDNEQNTPLMIALLSQQDQLVRYLIKVGASITLKGMDGMTALHIAAKCGYLSGCKLLINSVLSKKNYIDSVDDGGWTALVWACEHGHVDLAKYLIRQGADFMLRDAEQNIALHWAAFSGSSQIIELLSNLGSDINAVNAHGDTPLHIGSRQDSYTSVITLLARGADVNVRNNLGEAPLNCTTKDGDCYRAIELNVYLRGVVSSDNKLQSILTNDISKGKESNPIQCVNAVNDEPKPIDFVYISKNCITTDINIDVKITSLQACGCEDRCTLTSCGCAKNSIRCWYDEDGKLIPEFNYADPPMIFECNEACSCNVITCTNRVVQRGIMQRFQLYRTQSKGWGIKTLKNISKGTFVCEYIGEIINDFEADQRDDDSYLFDLDNRENDAYCIDARHYGNFARFINHSCTPNLIPIRIFIEHQDLRFPRIALFANRSIYQDEELSFDYGEKFWVIKCKKFTCKCGSNNCKYSKDTISETVLKYKQKSTDNSNAEDDELDTN